MKKVLFLSFCLVASVCFFSCTTESKTIVATSVSTTSSKAYSRTLEPQTYPILADLDIKTQKVTGVYNYECDNGETVDESMLKSNAVFQALKEIKADILVAPQYHFNTKIMGRQYITVTVTGYPAYYKNFRPISEFSEVETIETNSGATVIVAKDQSRRILGYQVVGSDQGPRTIDMNLQDYNNGQVNSSVILNVPASENPSVNENNEKSKSNAFSKIFGKKR